MKRTSFSGNAGIGKIGRSRCRSVGRRFGGLGGRRAAMLLLAFMWATAALMGMTPTQVRADPTLGSEGNPYIVTTAAQLNDVRQHLDAYYRLDADIALTGDWTPIGFYYEWGWLPTVSPFTGHFDGNGHTVSGLSFTTSDASYAGLFGHIGSGAEVADLKLEDVNVTGTSFMVWGVGALAGKLEGRVDNVRVSGGVIAGQSNIGGLVGETAAGAEIAGSSTDVNVQNNGFFGAFGGLVGQITGGSVADSSATGDVSGGSAFNVGGLIGTATQASVSGSYAEGQVESGGYAGGLVGNATNVAVSGSYASGKVIASGGSFVGGLVGYAFGGSVHNSYAKGDVEGMSDVGGLIGTAADAAAVGNSYAAGKVSPSLGDFGGGGLIGALQAGTVVASYYDKQTATRSDEDRGAPKTTAQMGQEGTYAGWDFTGVWNLDARDGYPGLIAFDRTNPAVRSAAVEDEAPGRIELTLYERVNAGADLPDHLLVRVNGNPVAVDEVEGDGTATLSVVLNESVSAGQTVSVEYSGNGTFPVKDRAGNPLADAVVPVDNQVLSTFVVTDYAPANGAEHVPLRPSLVLTFNGNATAVAGKQIELRKAANGRVVETIAADDGGRVSLSGATATITPSAALAPMTVYSVTIQHGAFVNEANQPMDGITDAAAWTFTTAADSASEAEWVHVGKAGFSAGSAGSPSLFAAGGTLYAAYRDGAHAGKATVMKYDAAAAGWTPVGLPGFSAGPVDSPALAFLGGAPIVAYQQRVAGSYEVAVMRLNGAGWVPIGDPLPSGDDSDPALLADGGSLYVAYRDGTDDDRAAVKRYDAGTGSWTALGAGGSAALSAGPVYQPTLAAVDGVLYASFMDYEYPTFGATVKAYNEAADEWETVGDRWFTEGLAFDPVLFVDSGMLYVSYENDLHKATLMKYDEAEDRWETVGGSGFSADQAFDASLSVFDGDPYVAYQDYAHNSRLTVMTYAGNRWNPVGAAGFSEGQAYRPSLLVADGNLYAAYEDAGNGNRLTVMTYAENEAPTADRVSITGTAQVGGTLTGTYGYSDADGDPEEGSAYRWYAADETNGNRPTAIPGATASTLPLTADLLGKYILFEVTPEAATGKLKGAAAASAAVGPVAAAPDNSWPTVVAYSPSNGAANVAVDMKLSLAFSEPVTATAGKSVAIVRLFDNGVAAAFDAADPSAMTVTGTTYTYSLATGLSYATGYYVRIDAGAFEDAAGHEYAGIAGAATWSFATAAPPLTAPPAPTGLTASAGDGRVALHWNASEGAAAYRIYARTSAGVYGGVPAAAVTDTVYKLGGLTNGATYYFAVRASNAAGDSGYSNEASAVPQALPPAPGNNADLIALSLSGGTLVPAFAPQTTVYAATVPYGVDSTRVTAAVYDAAASVSINGRPAAGGQPSEPFGLAVGSQTIAVEVAAPDGVTRKTYAIAVTRAPLPPDDSSEDPSGETPTDDGAPPDGDSPPNNVPDRDEEAGLIVTVNGQIQERIASGTVREEDGRVTVSVKVDAARLASRLNAEGTAPVVVIPVARDADGVSVELTGDAVKAMENKQAVLVVQTPNGSYRLPAANVLIDQWSGRLGGQVKLEEMVVRIDIAKSGSATVARLADAAQAGGFAVIVPPVDFTVRVSYGGSTLEVDRFGAYVERDIPLPADADRTRITTAVVLEDDGTIRHVPTYVALRDGSYAAVVNSLTNSAYTLIWHPVAFADMKAHWAETAVNDMASRMIVNGMEPDRFEPDRPVTRAEFAAIVVRALGLADRGATGAFRDVPAGDWYAGAVAKANEYGLIAGYEDGAFRPDRTIIREEAMAIVARAMGWVRLDADVTAAETEEALSRFADGASVDGWARPAAAATVSSGLIDGSAGSLLLPHNEMTRAETAVLVWRLLQQANLINGR